MSDTLRAQGEQFVILPKNILEYTQDKSAFMLYYALKWHTNGSTGETFPSYTRLQKMTGMGRNTISKALKHLVEVDLIQVIKDENKASNQYILPWKSSLDEASAKTKLVSEQNLPSIETKPSLVSERNSNYMNLNKRSNDKKRDIDRIKNDSDFQKTWLKEKLNPLQEKYTKDELNEFYKYWTTACDVSGESNLTKELTKPKQAQKGFSVAQRVAYAKRVGMLNKRTDSKGAPQQQKTFYELERQQKVDNLNHALNYNPFAEDLKDV